MSAPTTEETEHSAPRREALSLSSDNYGPFWAYVTDDRVTDADFNGSDLWITDVDGRRTQITDHGITSDFVNAFSQRVANQVSKPFNKMNPLLEAETSTLRISVLHESAAVSGRSICLRKSLPNVRIDARTILETGYASREVLNLLVNCIRAKMNYVIGGEPGAGKTELLKFLTQFIPSDQRVITIEDSPEWHFKKINPGHDCVEMRVSKELDYAGAIKTCLRQNPKWIALSEARGEEAKWLITSWSTGVNGVTTLHTDDIRKIPGRLIAMMNDRNDAERMISDIYDFVNVAILVRRKALPDGTAKRYIDQVGFLYRDGEEHGVMQQVRDGAFVDDRLPADIVFRLERAGITRPFECPDLDAQLGDAFVYGAPEPVAAPEPVPAPVAAAPAPLPTASPVAPAAQPPAPLRRTSAPIRPVRAAAPSLPASLPPSRAPRRLGAPSTSKGRE